MFKHPIYLAICVLAGFYLWEADAGGWSLWNTVSTPSTMGSAGGNYASFHHK